MMQSTTLLRALAASAGLALAGCATSSTAPPTTATAPAAAPTPDPVVKGTGLTVANIDPSVSPCDDFFHYASGSWLKNNPIPAAETRWGSFNELADKNNATQRAILDELARNAATAAPGTNEQKVGDYYASAMDTVAIEAAGLRYLKPHLDRIAAAKTLADLQRLQYDPKAHTGNSWFGAYVGQDDKKSDEYAVGMSQGGLSLPDRDYYLKEDARSKAIRGAYQTYLVNTFRMLGDAAPVAQKNAATVLRIETRLAKASRSRVDLRDPEKNYNKMSVAQLAKRYPNLGIPTGLKLAGLGTAQTVIVGQPEFLQEVNTMFKAEPLADQKTYLRWHTVSAVMPALPKAFGDEAFRFAQVLSGAKKQQPRWKRMLRATDNALGEAFGQLYVDKAFTPEAKQRAQELVNNLKETYAERIKANAWMSEATKQEALKKLAAFTVKIGYPDKWKDYSAMKVSRASYLNNLYAAQEWAFQDNVKKLGRPVDRLEWGMTPPTVNAYYNPSMNEIVFPAGILQPPFYDPKADDAVNYGGIGAVIGHEMTHGFDDQGRQYDAQGNLRDWWTKDDADKFKARAAVVGQQFSKFSPLDSVYVNGDLTMGENLADLGGLSIAYQAFQKTDQFKAQQKLDGFTPPQRFFLGYAQIWRTNARPEYLRQQVQVDPHSPAQFRTNGPLMNMPQFYEAFGCQEDARMVRAATARAQVW
ncbi:M13 family metallopeptidase [uncultured Hymenobacter sp.]|uniref:M13 family metallopeptidase n=1 Tax=uncultured Hymenobacter sp. TaxID=170016 RepID=UPI0035C99AA9